MIVKTSRGDLPVKYGFNALAKFGDIAGISMDKVMSMNLTEMKLSDLMAFIYVGFVYGAKAEGTECKVKDIEDVGDMLDEDGAELITRVMEAFSEMSPQKVGESKKK